MKNTLVLIFSMLSFTAFSQSWNPLITSVYILPSPVDLAQGENATLYISMGNGGFNEMNNLSSPLRAVVSLSGFAPRTPQDIYQSVIGADFFNVTYLADINSLYFEQKVVIPGALDGSINDIQILVRTTVMSSKEQPRNGFQINIVPPGYTNNTNNQDDDRADIMTYTINALLPVELTEFYAASEDCQMNVHWATASELNNDGFILEKSLDTKTWKEVAQVKGHGTSSLPHTYKVVDTEEEHSSVVYYRLTQRDFDGTTETSKIISVYAPSCQDAQFQLFPNPTSDYVKVLWNGGESLTESAKVEIYTSTGQLLKTIPVQNRVEQISVTDMIPGAYLFVAQSGSSQMKNTVIIQR